MCGASRISVLSSRRGNSSTERDIYRHLFTASEVLVYASFANKRFCLPLNSHFELIAHVLTNCVLHSCRRQVGAMFVVGTQSPAAAAAAAVNFCYRNGSVSSASAGNSHLMHYSQSCAATPTHAAVPFLNQPQSLSYSNLMNEANYAAVAMVAAAGGVAYHNAEGTYMQYTLLLV